MLGTFDHVSEAPLRDLPFETRNLVWEPSETRFGRFRECIYIAESDSGGGIRHVIYQIKDLDEPNKMEELGMNTLTGSHFRKPYQHLHGFRNPTNRVWEASETCKCFHMKR